MTRRQIDVAATASELRIVVGHLVRRLRGELRFPLTQAAALGRLDRDGPQTTSALAKAELVRPQSMAQTVGDLEDAGLVARRADPADGRQTLLELTAAGREALAADRRSRDGWLAQVIAEELDPAEQEALVRAVDLLRRLGQA
jgi:DNA-binding MarR family transcriptional regulator